MPTRDLHPGEAVNAFSLRGYELFPVSQGVSTAHVASVEQLGDYIDSERDYSAQYSLTSPQSVGTSPAATVWDTKDWEFPSGGWGSAGADIGTPVPGWYLVLVTLKLALAGKTGIVWQPKLIYRLSAVNTDVAVRQFVVGGTGAPDTGDWVTMWMVRYFGTSETARLLKQASATGTSFDTGSLIQMILLSRDQ